MESTDLLDFALALERRLRPIDELHAYAKSQGFNAWEVFIEERLKVIEKSKRHEEVRRLLMCCREEFCNFTRYTRETGGDGLRLPELERLRVHGGGDEYSGSYLLESDVVMQQNLALARGYAMATKGRVMAVLADERSQYQVIAKSVVNQNPLSSLRDQVQALLHGIFARFGFQGCASRSRDECFNKELRTSGKLLVCVKDVGSIATPGWRGGVAIEFYLVPGFKCLDSFVQIGCHEFGIPLRITGLAPNLAAYGNPNYFLGAQHTSGVYRDIVKITEQESLLDSQFLISALAQVSLVINCYLTFLSAVEESVDAACAEFVGNNDQGLAN
ncbi:MAG: hypothetical protein AB1899_11950 [Pseudomonadota bacterium]